MSTSTAQLLIYDAAVAALRANPALADGRVTSMRDGKRALLENAASQLRVFIDQSVPAAIIGGPAPVQWETTLRVECVARDGISSVGLVSSSALDTASVLCAQVQQRLLASLAALSDVSEITPAPMLWGEDVADTTLVVCQCQFRISHRSAFATLIV